MKKPSKSEVVNGIQLFLMLNSMVLGFWLSYVLIWVKIGLPTGLFAAVITIILAILSVYGLIKWIQNS